MVKSKQRSSHNTPDFIIAGVQKAATTWLEEQLRNDPRVFTPGKEIHFFDQTKNFVKGEKWYLKHFDGASELQIIGEKTPDYFWTNCSKFVNIEQNNMAYIRQVLPRAKIIVILRVPVERFVSAWNHNTRRGRIRPSIGLNDLKTNAAYENIYEGMIQRGFYGRQLNTALAHFSHEDIKIVFHDDIKKNPRKILIDVKSFLGLSASAEDMETLMLSADQMTIKQHCSVSVLLARFPRNLRSMRFGLIVIFCVGFQLR